MSGLSGKNRGNGPRFSDRQWGLIGFAVVAIILGIIAAISVVDLDSTEYRADVSDAGAIKKGADVRLAGITVGEVTDVSLHSDHASITFTVEDDVFVGSQTSLSVRMLTVVGGHYIALQPAGSTPLGTATIPADRVILPYSVPEIFQDAIEPVSGIEGDTLRKTMKTLGRATADNPQSLKRAVAAVDSIVEILDKQNADVSRTLAMADEYVGAIEDTKSSFKQIIDSWVFLEDLAEEKMVITGKALTSVATILESLSPLGKHYNSTLRPMAIELAKAQKPLGELINKWSDLVGSITQIGDKLRTAAGEERTPITICVPTPEKGC